MYQRLEFLPGIDKENTSYSSEGKWADSQLIRFVSGKPEKIKGWQRKLDQQLQGVCRFSIVWKALDGSIYISYGTNSKMYVESGATLYDITPIRRDVVLGTDPLATNVGTTTVVVTDPTNGAVSGSFITLSGATAVGGVPADEINKEHQITVIDDNTYSIEVTTGASSTAIGGGAAANAEYQINVGQADQVYAYGFGAGVFGGGTWGTPRDSTEVTLDPRTWTGDNWGEDYIFSPYGGAVYLWDASFPQNRAVEITQAPSKNNGIFVTADRHLVCYGCNNPNNDGSQQNGLDVRWCDQENYTVWDASITNTAGRYTLTGGTQIASGGAVEGQNILFTDEDVYSMQHLGPPYTFGFQQIGASAGIASPQAWAAYNGAVYWMGNNAFYFYSGAVMPLDSSLQTFVFHNISLDQQRKVHITVDKENHEITWFYPTQSVEPTYLNAALPAAETEVNVATTAGFRDSGDLYIGMERISYTSKNDTQFLGCTRGVAGTEDVHHYEKEEVSDPDNNQPLEPCRYVTYSVVDEVWWCGRLERGVMVDRGAIKNPIGTTRDGVIYEHDFGRDADGLPMVAHVESSDFDLAEGDHLMFVRMCVPDFTLPVGSVNLSLRTRYYAQSSQVNEAVGNVVQTTEKINTRIRGRQMSVRVESNDLGDEWKYGSPRIDIQPDGRR